MNKVSQSTSPIVDPLNIPSMNSNIETQIPLIEPNDPSMLVDFQIRSIIPTTMVYTNNIPTIILSAEFYKFSDSHPSSPSTITQNNELEPSSITTTTSPSSPSSPSTNIDNSSLDSSQNQKRILLSVPNNVYVIVSLISDSFSQNPNQRGKSNNSNILSENTIKITLPNQNDEEIVADLTKFLSGSRQIPVIENRARFDALKIHTTSKQLGGLVRLRFELNQYNSKRQKWVSLHPPLLSAPIQVFSHTGQIRRATSITSPSIFELHPDFGSKSSRIAIRGVNFVNSPNLSVKFGKKRIPVNLFHNEGLVIFLVPEYPFSKIEETKTTNGNNSRTNNSKKDVLNENSIEINESSSPELKIEVSVSNDGEHFCESLPFVLKLSN